MNKFYCFLLSIVFVFISCNKSTSLLKEAQDLIYVDVEQSMSLLDSIKHPERLSEGDYLRYVTLRTYAKHQLKQDITHDTAVFRAQPYFCHTDHKLAAIGSFCAGWIHRHKKDNIERKIKSFLHAEYHAVQSNNYELAGRSANNMGRSYYEHGIMDSAIVYFKKALNYYDSTNASAKNKVTALLNISHTYCELNQCDEANQYLDRVMEFKDSSIHYQVHIDKGVILNKQNKYDESIPYFQASLRMTSQTEDSLRVYLNLSRTYGCLNNPDSVRHYNNLIDNRISNIADISLLSAIYNNFSDFYEKAGNISESLKYARLEKDAKEKMAVSRQAQHISNAKNLFSAEMLHRAHQEEKHKVTRAGGSIIIFLLTAIMWLLWNRKTIKTELQETHAKLIDLNGGDNLTLFNLGKVVYIYIRQTYVNDWAKRQAEKQLIERIDRFKEK